jgi:transcriptional regulator with XRE-family HTH domain
VAIDTTAPLYARIGKRIRAAREELGLTQKALASLVRLTRTSVTNIERGKQKLLVHTLVDFAKALGVDAGELLVADDMQVGSAEELDELIKARPRIERDWIKATIDAGAKGG